MGNMTKEESMWLDELQEVLDRCPSLRLDFLAMGDEHLFLWDKDKNEGVNGVMVLPGQVRLVEVGES